MNPPEWEVGDLRLLLGNPAIDGSQKQYLKAVAMYINFPALGPGARFSKLPVITGPVKLFCFSFQLGVSEGLKIVQ